MTELKLSALAVEAITVASLKSGVAKKAIFRPDTAEERKARSAAMDHMKLQGASICEIAHVFGMTATAVRKAIKRSKP